MRHVDADGSGVGVWAGVARILLVLSCCSRRDVDAVDVCLRIMFAGTNINILKLFDWPVFPTRSENLIRVKMLFRMLTYFTEPIYIACGIQVRPLHSHPTSRRLHSHSSLPQSQP